MPLETLAQTLNARHTSRSAAQALRVALDAPELNEIALVSSFGAESSVLLHLVAVTDPSLRIIFLDTGKHFTETLVYQQEITERFGLKNVRIATPLEEDVKSHDPAGRLSAQNANACCAMRKSAPLERALANMPNLGALITGRKRFQSAKRSTLDVFEADPAMGLIKVNPLAHWTARDLRDYREENRLPKHPLVAKGYLSIGCAPCTVAVRAGEDARSGRWAGNDKTECGIHFINGRAMRGPIKQKDTV